jgi:formylglycine-generating enzyme required for sulfatase activity
MTSLSEQRAIQPQKFQPTEASRGSNAIQLWQWALGAILLSTAAALWFLFTAKSVVISFSPDADAMTISGGISIHLGDVVLLREGTYTVTAQAQNHKPLSQSLAVTEASSQTAQFRFVPNPGILALSRGPADAAVYIDGVKQSSDNPSASVQLSVEAGRHQLELRHPRYLSRNLDIDIEGKGQTQALSVELAPAWSEVSVRSEPAGANILVDDTDTGLKTPAIVEIMQGERALRIQKPGFKAFRQRLLAVAGVAQNIDSGRLIQADAQLTVSSTPNNAAVTINGAYYGQTPLQIDLQSNIDHNLRLIHPGYAQSTQKLQLKRGEVKDIRLKLERLLGEVRIKTRPENALITINGKPVDLNREALLLPLEPQDVRVTLPGYAGFNTTLNPRAGLVQELKVQLLTLQEARIAALIPVVNTPQGHTLRLLSADVVQMGASRREPGRRANEAMRQAEFNRLFYLAEREVSNAQFRAFASGHDSGVFQDQTLDDDDQPVVNISWHEAAAYCNWLSQQQGYDEFYAIEFGKVIGTNPSSTGYRLPTEAEWAWAARRQPSANAENTLPEQLKFPWGNALPPPERFANYADRAAGNLVGRVIFGYNDNYGVSAPVGTFKPNAHGLYDLGGNVAEWIHDWYEIPDQATVVDHRGPVQGEYKVIRGASWMHGTITELRLSFRDYGIDARNDVGFRVARYAE